MAIKVLVVDDHLPTRALIKTILEAEKNQTYTVIEVRTSPDAGPPPQPVSDAPGRAVPVDGQEGGPPVLHVGEVDTGVGAHEAVRGLGDDKAVGHADHALRMPQDELGETPLGGLRSRFLINAFRALCGLTPQQYLRRVSYEFRGPVKLGDRVTRGQRIAQIEAAAGRRVFRGPEPSGEKILAIRGDDGDDHTDDRRHDRDLRGRRRGEPDRPARLDGGSRPLLPLPPSDRRRHDLPSLAQAQRRAPAERAALKNFFK